MKRIEITVRGRVQGVAFRWHAQREAVSLGLKGWVRNQADGSVRMVAEGAESALARLAAWAEHGPTHARVDSREIFWSDAAGAFTDFDITG
jgi:acylphosphatase